MTSKLGRKHREEWSGFVVLGRDHRLQVQPVPHRSALGSLIPKREDKP